jgi:hypothetical protein
MRIMTLYDANSVMIVIVVAIVYMSLFAWLRNKQDVDTSHQRFRNYVRGRIVDACVVGGVLAVHNVNAGRSPLLAIVPALVWLLITVPGGRWLISPRS